MKSSGDRAWGRHEEPGDNSPCSVCYGHHTICFTDTVQFGVEGGVVTVWWYCSGVVVAWSSHCVGVRDCGGIAVWWLGDGAVFVV